MQFDETVLYEVFDLVFIEKEDEHHYLPLRLKYKGKDFHYIKQHYHDYSLYELYEILMYYDLIFKYRNNGTINRVMFTHKNSVNTVCSWLKTFLIKSAHNSEVG